VDLSKTYLTWAEENMALNVPVDSAKQRFIHADVLQWLDEVPAGSYDLVILDPPTFSNSKRMKDFLDIQRDHAELINKTLRAMTSRRYAVFQHQLPQISAGGGQNCRHLDKGYHESHHSV
jgi:23S rRNA (cytosine1962-C5)-methyltransferase